MLASFALLGNKPARYNTKHWEDSDFKVGLSLKFKRPPRKRAGRPAKNPPLSTPSSLREIPSRVHLFLVCIVCIESSLFPSRAILPPCNFAVTLPAWATTQQLSNAAPLRREILIWKYSTEENSSPSYLPFARQGGEEDTVERDKNASHVSQGFGTTRSHRYEGTRKYCFLAK